MWEHNPLIPPEQYGAIVRLLTFFADQLSALINQIVLEQKNAEPPLVQKARDYIEKHKGETLRSACSGASSRRERLSFLQSLPKIHRYKIHRLRRTGATEDARTQFLNPNRRISEVAYDVGFQSLTQFNRMFKRVFGQSPSEFRAGHSSRKRPKKAA